MLWFYHSRQVYNNFNLRMNYRSYSLKQPYTPTKQTVITYPEEIDCIIDPVNGVGGVYIGNLEAAQNLRTLSKYNIKAVMTAAAEANVSYDKKVVPHHIRLPATDHESFPIQKYFDQAHEFLDLHLNRTNVLVHCMAGISRSVSLFIAYLIRKRGMTYEQAYRLVKDRRKIIFPNSGFVAQLKKLADKHRRIGSPERSSFKSLPDNPEDYRTYTSTTLSPKKKQSKLYEIQKPYEKLEFKTDYKHKYQSEYNTKDRYSSLKKSQQYVDEMLESLRQKYQLNKHDNKYDSNYDINYKYEYTRPMTNNYMQSTRRKLYSINDIPTYYKYGRHLY